MALSLYIHIPWCVKKCYYCDFNSHQASRDQVLRHEQNYIQALQQDWRQELNRFPHGPPQITSIFIGGGTPSLFSASAIDQLMRSLLDEWGVKKDSIEITIEANPATTDNEKLIGFRESGINRISFGAQSFEPLQLQQLGRIHSVEEIYTAMTQARQAGFTRINIDLMYGLINQTPWQCLNDLQKATELEPDHISWYQLTIEPLTAFGKRPPPLPEDEALWAMTCDGLDFLGQHGFERYEISAWSKVQDTIDQRCVHNINYWEYGDFVGIGAGAHSKITQDENIIRYAKIASPSQYIQHAGNQSRVASCETVQASSLPLDALMNFMRLCEGFAIEKFKARTNIPDPTVDEILQHLLSNHWIEIHGNNIIPSQKALRFQTTMLLEICA
ncbi:MAG: radical SAM family heme chaperone HemW [Methylacidiphilales bacterium]|nr:radical SAM family heme chaperone HemW [Candidatus Methylacidiphilales bacterium]